MVKSRKKNQKTKTKKNTKNKQKKTKKNVSPADQSKNVKKIFNDQQATPQL